MLLNILGLHFLSLQNTGFSDPELQGLSWEGEEPPSLMRSSRLLAVLTAQHHLQLLYVLEFHVSSVSQRNCVRICGKTSGRLVLNVPSRTQRQFQKGEPRPLATPAELEPHLRGSVV